MTFSAALSPVSENAVGHMVPSRYAASLKPNAAYLALNLSAPYSRRPRQEAGGDYAGFETDIDLRRGRNTAVYDFSALEVRNEDLPDYARIIPSLCTIDGECPTD